jgi:hypothetical protein
MKSATGIEIPQFLCHISSSSCHLALIAFNAWTIARRTANPVLLEVRLERESLPGKC